MDAMTPATMPVVRVSATMPASAHRLPTFIMLCRAPPQLVLHPQFYLQRLNRPACLKASETSCQPQMHI